MRLREGLRAAFIRPKNVHSNYRQKLVQVFAKVRDLGRTETTFSPSFQLNVKMIFLKKTKVKGFQVRLEASIHSSSVIYGMLSK